MAWYRRQMKTPLRVLIETVEEGGYPPFDWVVEHAPDGSLDDLWEASTHADEMFYLFAMSATRWEVFDAARAICEDLLADLIAATPSLRQSSRFFAANEEYEAWLRLARNRTWVETSYVEPPDARGAGPATYLSSLLTDPSLPSAAYAFAGSVARASTSNPARGIRRAADIIRAHVSAPTLASLLK